MAGPVNTTNAPTTTPGAVPGAPPTEGIQALEGEVVPGEEIPLPTGADGKPLTTGSGTPPPPLGEGAIAQSGQPTAPTAWSARWRRS